MHLWQPRGCGSSVCSSRPPIGLPSETTPPPPSACSAASFNGPSDRWHVYPVLLVLTSPLVKTRWHCPPCILQKIRSLLQDFHWLVLQLDCFNGDAANHVELLLGHRLHQLPQHHHCVTWPVCVLVTFLASRNASHPWISMVAVALAHTHVQVSGVGLPPAGKPDFGSLSSFRRRECGLLVGSVKHQG